MPAKESKRIGSHRGGASTSSATLPSSGFVDLNEPVSKADFIKHGDLIYLHSNDHDSYFYGDGVKNRCVGRLSSDPLLEANFINTIFRIQPKFEYGAHKELEKALQAADTVDKYYLQRLQEAAEMEQRQNDQELKDHAGEVLYYGQIIQLVNIGSNTYLTADKRERADLDPSCLKVSLNKQGSKNCWFKLMPRFKVRFEGEKIRRGDQVTLIHLKSGQFVQLSDQKYEDDGLYEINLYNQQTGWHINHYAPFLPESDAFIMGGSVVRIYHPETDTVLQSNLTPLFDQARYQAFLHSKSKKHKNIFSSNTLVQIELKNAIQGGVIPWQSQCRLKHMGSEKYFVLLPSPLTKEADHLHLGLTKDVRDDNTLFILYPVDKGSPNATFGAFFRLQHALTGRWLHAGEFIQDDRKVKTDSFSFSKNKYHEVYYTEKFHYQDALSFIRVDQQEVDDLNYVNGLYAILTDFVEKLRSKGESLTILEIESAPIRQTLGKLINFINDSNEPNPLKQDGLPNTANQRLLDEQLVMDKAIEIVLYLFGGTPEKWLKKPEEMSNIYKKGLSGDLNKHLKEMCKLLNKFLQMMAKGNTKMGIKLSKWLDLFALQINSGTRAREVCIEMFRNNFDLLNNISHDRINTFLDILRKQRDSKVLEFLTELCACGDTPILGNQMFILENLLVKHPDLILETRLNEKEDRVEVNLSKDDKDDWVPIEVFLIEPADNEEKKKKKKQSSTFEIIFPYRKDLKDEIEYYKQLLRLFAKLCAGENKDAINFISSQDEGRDALITVDAILHCLQNNKLPGSLRASCADLLYLWSETELPSKPDISVKYTWSWNELEEDYKHNESTTTSQYDRRGWLKKCASKLQSIVLDILKTHNLVPSNKENSLLVLAILRLLEKLIKYGYYIQPEEQREIMPVLLRVMGLEEDLSDTARYNMSEYTYPIMEAKLQSCLIFHSYFDLRLEERTAVALTSFKKEYENGSIENDQKEVDNRKSLMKRASSANIELKTLKHGTTNPLEVGLAGKADAPFDEKQFIQLLLDLAQHQHEPLTTSSLSLLLRYMRPYDEILSTLEHVQLLTDAESVKTFYKISEDLSVLRGLLKDNDISEDEEADIIKILKDWIQLCTWKGDLNKPNPKNQIIFRNLRIHEEIFRLLNLPYRKSYHYIFKLCYLFFKQFVLYNRPNQALLFPHLEFILSQMGMKLNISDTMIEILNNNHQLCTKVEPSFIQHMVKLIVSHGFKRKYLGLLNVAVEAEGHHVPQNQNLVITLLMQKRAKTLVLWDQLKRKRRKNIIQDEKPQEQDDGPKGIDKSFDRAATSSNLLVPRKLTLEAYEAAEKARVRDDDEEDLLYHIQLIELLARCCLGFHHMPEMLCQTVVPLQTCHAVMLDPEADILVKAAYCRFISEVWLLTERAVNTRYDDRMWEIVDFCVSEINGYLKDKRRRKKGDDVDENYIYRGIISMLKIFFAFKFDQQELTSTQLGVVNRLVEALSLMLEVFQDDSKKLQLVGSCLQVIQESKIEGVRTKDEKLADVIEKAKSKMNTLSSKTIKQVQAAGFEEKRMARGLKDYITKLSETKTSDNQKTVLVSEFEDIVRIFRDNLIGVGMPVNTRFTEKIISQLKPKEGGDKLIVDCLRILTAMISLDNEELESNNNFNEKLEEENNRRADARVSVQNKLDDLHILSEALELLQSNNSSVIYHTLQLLCALLDGGNDQVQKSFMKFFLSSSDPHFFEDIRNRIMFAIEELKYKRRSNAKSKKGGMTEITEESLAEIMDVKDEPQSGYVDLVLLLLQNLCEGHFTQMKNYLRDQYDNTTSFNIIKECATLATELERSIEDNIPLSIQLFRSLNEFVSGCHGNAISVMESKIYIPVNRILQKIDSDNSAEALRLKLSMMELLSSLVEGQFPERNTDISSIPPVLMASIDYKVLQSAMLNAWAVAEPFLPKQRSQLIPREETEEGKYAIEFISASMIFLKILIPYDESSTTPLIDVLARPEWSYFVKKFIGSVEIIDDTGELQRVYFRIPTVCKNLSDKTKQQFMRDVKRDSPTEKLEDFLQKSSLLRFEITHQTKIIKSKLSFISSLSNYWRYSLLIITMVQNILMLAYYREPDQMEGVVIDNDAVNISMNVLGAFHIFFTLLMCAGFAWNQVPLIVHHGRKEDEEEARQKNLASKKQGLLVVQQFETKWLWDMWYLIRDGWFVYHAIYLFFSVLGIFYPGFYSFHMLDLSLRSQQVRNVLKSVTLNGRSILLTALLMLIIVYLYSVIAFFFLRDSFRDPGLDCDYLFKCFLATINFGFRSGGGIAEVLEIAVYEDEVYWARFVYDMTFFMIIIIILLNIVFGIILDTFGELRDQRNSIEEDIRSRCFICSIESDVFQRQAFGFNNHIKHEHNMWHYLYYFIYLDTKDKDEFTAAEEYVFSKREKGEIDWFPVSRSISITDFDTKKD